MALWKIVNPIGGILIAIGLILALNSVLTSSNTHTENGEILPGYLLYYETTSEIAGGSLTGTYTVSTGSVDFYIFTASQWEEYKNTGIADNLYHNTGSSGSYSVTFPDIGKYYMVANHAPANIDDTQHLTLTYTMKGVVMTFVIIGVALLAAGIVMLVFGFRMKKKETAEHQKLVNDVTLFEAKK